MTEYWTAIRGFEGRYEVSSFGRVRSLTQGGRGGSNKRKEPHLRKVFRDRRGHILVSLHSDKLRSYNLCRLVYEHFVGSIPDGMHIDHIDRDPTNNHVSNLRCATRTQNAANSKCRAGAKTGFKGVTKVGDKYTARVCLKGTRIVVGRFATPEEAAKAYDAKAKELFGVYANPNFKDA